MTQTFAPPGSAADRHREKQIGLAAAFGAFFIWGLSPIYFKAVDQAGAVEILAQRVLWTLLLITALTAAMGRLGEALALLRQPRRLPIYLLSTVLVTVNWLVYIVGILSDRVLEVSLGYYINPLVNVILGMLFLHERLSRWQALAVGLAAVGVAVPVVGYGGVPWLSLALACSFGTYALVRKKAAIDPQIGLLIETALLAPLALITVVVLEAGGNGHFLIDWRLSALLMLSGFITGGPLLLFMHGAQRLNLSTIGLMQYLAPSIQFGLAVAVFHETFTITNLITFALIWAALAVFSWESIRSYRRLQRVEPTT